MFNKILEAMYRARGGLVPTPEDRAKQQRAVELGVGKYLREKATQPTAEGFGKFCEMMGVELTPAQRTYAEQHIGGEPQDTSEPPAVGKGFNWPDVDWHDPARPLAAVQQARDMADKLKVRIEEVVKERDDLKNALKDVEHVRDMLVEDIKPKTLWDLYFAGRLRATDGMPDLPVDGTLRNTMKRIGWHAAEVVPERDIAERLRVRVEEVVKERDEARNAAGVLIKENIQLKLEAAQLTEERDKLRARLNLPKIRATSFGS